MSVIEFTPHKTGRKQLAQAIAGHLGVDVIYLGAPSFAYQIGQATLDRNWALQLPTQADANAVLAAAKQAGFNAPVAGAVGLTVTMPATGWSEATRANLQGLLASKGALIARALGIADTPVEFGADTVSFPWFTTMPPEQLREATIELIAALCQRAETITRASSKPPAPGNDKYSMRCLLLALGFIGSEYKQLRRMLLANLDGDGAWRTPKNQEVAR
ncbi:hypothetical protein ACRQDV_08725 [Actinotignum sp. GS-2025e]|uniref:hypothetical protein n=1 Tax=Actinotignum sp. GS-2025e TaxID=3427278 RepID=UPI003F4536CA